MDAVGTKHDSRGCSRDLFQSPSRALSNRAVLRRRVQQSCCRDPSCVLGFQGVPEAEQPSLSHNPTRCMERTFGKALATAGSVPKNNRICFRVKTQLVGTRNVACAYAGNADLPTGKGRL